ncbi:peptide deformylase [Actinomadura keratinilytica]
MELIGMGARRPRPAARVPLPGWARHVGHLASPVLDDVPAADRRLVEEPEGCLSVPGPYRVVPRLDRARRPGPRQGRRPLVIVGRGYFARCLQHETDHLGGHLYLDRLARRERKSALQEMRGSQDELFARRAAAAKRLGK